MRSLWISLLVLAALIAWLILSQPDDAVPAHRSPRLTPVTYPITDPWYGER
jgi:hypothetical protein